MARWARTTSRLTQGSRPRHHQQGDGGGNVLHPGPGDDYIDGGGNDPLTSPGEHGDLVSYQP